MLLKVLFSICFAVLAGGSLAFSAPAVSANDSPPLANSQLEEAAPPPMSAELKKKICRQYEGRVISYYGNVYKVQKCQRYEYSSEEVYEITKQGVSPQEVDNEVISALAHGGSYAHLRQGKKNGDPCKRFQKQYITFAVDVYWVEGCSKRRFPDWASYESHRGKLGSRRSQLHFVSWEEFASLKEGKEMASVIDDELRKVSDTVDILPIDEACQSIIGKFVTYYDQIYYIERTKHKNIKVTQCQKRPVNGEEYTRLHGHKSYYLKELSSSQAVSIPEGEPFSLSAKKSKKTGG